MTLVGESVEADNMILGTTVMTEHYYGDWRDDALYDLANTTLSFARIAEKYQRATATVTKLCDQHEIERPTGPRAPRDKSPLSPRHRAVGMRLTIYRGTNGAKEIAEELGVSLIVHHRMEIGTHDFTLRQLIAISEVIGVPISELTEPMVMSAKQKRGGLS